MRDAVVGMEPLAVLLHPRARAGLDLPWDEPLIQDPAAPRAPKGPSCFLRAEPLEINSDPCDIVTVGGSGSFPIPNIRFCAFPWVLGGFFQAN